MKTLQVLLGDDIHKIFRAALQVYWKLGCTDPITFKVNEVRVVIMPDSSDKEVQRLTWEEAKVIVEDKQD